MRCNCRRHVFTLFKTKPGCLISSWTIVRRVWIGGEAWERARRTRGAVQYQPDENAEELDDVSVGHGVQSTNQRVEERYAGRHNDGGLGWDLHDHRQCGACNQKPPARALSSVSMSTMTSSKESDDAIVWQWWRNMMQLMIVTKWSIGGLMEGFHYDAELRTTVFSQCP